MAIKVNVERKYVVNGKEYHSVEEMPEEIRQAYEKVVASGPVTVKTKITFNGQEYESIDAMSPAVRRLFENVMKAAEAGEVPPETIVGKEGMSKPVAAPKPIEPEPVFAFSQRWVIVGVVLLAILAGVYFFLYSSGAR